MSRVRTFLPAMLLLGLAAGGWACPTCEVGIGDETVKTVLSGYVWSYVFMAGCPFLVVGCVLFGTYRASRALDEQGA